MNIGEAIQRMKEKERVARQEWIDFDLIQELELQVPDEHSKMGKSYIYINEEGTRVPWVASHTDLLAEDWRVVL